MEQPLVSVIIPCRNEERYIQEVISDLALQDYPKERMEVIFIDGASTDDTKSIIVQATGKYNWLHVLDNPKRIVPIAMNLGIKEAKGDVIVRMDAHAAFPSDYISKLIYWQHALQADNVGGVWLTKPSSNSSKALAIAEVLSHPLGVGNSMFRIGVQEPTETDTVPFGCYRKNIFGKIGYYDERLSRNQDIELNKRLKAAGGKIFLVPDVTCTYYARDSFAKLAENNFRNGEWVILTSYYTGQLGSLSFRHFVPLFFLLYIILIPAFLLLHSILLLPLLVYVCAIALASAAVSFRLRRMAMFPFVFYGFLVLHLSYGAGSLYGIARWLARRV